MGLQNAAARVLAVPDLTTTVLTLTLTGLAADSTLAGGTNPRAGRRLVAAGAMLFGAAVGAFLVLHLGIGAALALTFVLLGLNAFWGLSPVLAPRGMIDPFSSIQGDCRHERQERCEPACRAGNRCHFGPWRPRPRGPEMNTVKTKDGVDIFYKDWGSGQPIVFSHGWPLSADDWDAQMLFFLSHGFRVIAYDRRGHGRSTQMADGHDMNHYADDLAALTAHLNLKDAVHVGHSTGGGEVVVR
jgi:hypothetical protein